jgi:prevent-host-death family protein
MTHVDATKARAQFSELTNRVAFGKERVIIDRSGKGVMAIVPIEDLELLEALEDKMDIDDAKKALNAKGGTAWDKFKAARGL